jgi:hypothetical protein
VFDKHVVRRFDNEKFGGFGQIRRFVRKNIKHLQNPTIFVFIEIDATMVHVCVENENIALFHIKDFAFFVAAHARPRAVVKVRPGDDFYLCVVEITEARVNRHEFASREVVNVAVKRGRIVGVVVVAIPELNIVRVGYRCYGR